ncbi:unnamed protein product [Colletotrichum noveboracense]|uniref:Uncharacterized protein n=1 Tax=Colletotrichum noveboracense TaxID=2664923 RepID=A0A9W4S5Q9_9PEZI|nr:unnamed protein product [Colletotrichum noveboracense]
MCFGVTFASNQLKTFQPQLNNGNAQFFSRDSLLRGQYNPRVNGQNPHTKDYSQSLSTTTDDVEKESVNGNIPAYTRDLLIHMQARPHVYGQVPYAKDYGRFSPTMTDYVVEGSVNGVCVEALPDTGSDDCVISSDFAYRLGQKPIRDTEKIIVLANNKTVQSPGMIEVLWKFANSQTPHYIKCWILPGCTKDLVLGFPFLETTETLTKFFHRVRKIKIATRLRSRLIGKQKRRVAGCLGARVTTAVADTGSDLMLVSLEYVQRYCLEMNTGWENCTEVELADGTSTWTCGIVKSAMWTIRESIVCDFHVLDGLAADVILCKDYLFDLNFFARHAGQFFDVDLDENISLLCGVRLIEARPYHLNKLSRELLKAGK